MSDRYQTILFEKKDRWAKITLNRPEVKNALSEVMTDELMSVFSEIEEDKRKGATDQVEIECDHVRVPALQEQEGAAARVITRFMRYTSARAKLDELQHAFETKPDAAAIAAATGKWDFT